ncbi:MAG TPA: ferrous iron transporter B [Bacteroidetes bacterium]|nr:ferrous iron transporter B [Bacteroidota bacterium]
MVYFQAARFVCFVLPHPDARYCLRLAARNSDSEKNKPPRLRSPSLNSLHRLALSGNPNSGKSTLFNELTGLQQKTGNLPGVTVEKKSGQFSYKKKRFQIIDIPGIYSLHARSADELVATSLILDNSREAAELFIFVADATQLRKSLFLFLQMQEAGCELILALNMFDLAEKRGLMIDLDLLSRELGVPVIPISASKKTGITELQDCISSYALQTPVPKQVVHTKAETFYTRIDTVLEKVQKWEAGKIYERSGDKWDRYLLHPVWGYLSFFLILFVIFQSVFFLAELPRQWIESGFLILGTWLGTLLPQGPINGLLVNGVLPGLSGVLMFLPQIGFLFLFLILLEDSGYMVRATLLMDKVMRKAGLNGRSVIPMISGVACAIPAILATRTIAQPRDRLITMFVIPFVSCSARLPVFVLLVSLILPNERFLGVFNYPGLALTGLYLLGFSAAFGTAWLMNRGMKKQTQDLFLMEIPEYRLPHWPVVLRQIGSRCMSFITEAGKIILGVSILLWALSNYGPADFHSGGAQTQTPLEESFAGIGGKAIEPLIAPLGYDWKIGIAIVSSFVAREVFVGSISTLYHIDNPDDHDSIIQILGREDGISGATAVSLVFFYLFALQCVSTMVVMKKETGGWKWPLIQFFFMGTVAYLSALIAYQLLS